MVQHADPPCTCCAWALAINSFSSSIEYHTEIACTKACSHAQIRFTIDLPRRFRWRAPGRSGAHVYRFGEKPSCDYGCLCKHLVDIGLVRRIALVELCKYLGVRDLQSGPQRRLCPARLRGLSRRGSTAVSCSLFRKPVPSAQWVSKTLDISSKFCRYCSHSFAAVSSALPSSYVRTHRSGNRHKCHFTPLWSCKTIPATA